MFEGTIKSSHVQRTGGKCFQSKWKDRSRNRD